MKIGVLWELLDSPSACEVYTKLRHNNIKLLKDSFSTRQTLALIPYTKLEYFFLLLFLL